MSDFLLNELGIVCLAFWIVLGFLIMLACYKVKPLDDEQGHTQEPNTEETDTSNPLLDHFREREALDHLDENDLQEPKQSTHFENQ